jgi:hypothetical protein
VEYPLGQFPCFGIAEGWRLLASEERLYDKQTKPKTNFNVVFVEFPAEIPLPPKPII